MIYDNKMNSQTLIMFIKRWIKDAVGKIFLIVDNLKVHHSYIVRDWLEVNEDKIEQVRWWIYFLPTP
jgi:hypothetical protein